MRRSAFLSLVLLVSVGCQRAPAQSQTTGTSTTPKPGSSAPATPGAQPAATPPPPAKPVPATLPDPVARVNGDPISKAEFERAVRNIEQRAGGAVPVERRDEIYRSLLDDLISFRLLVQEGKARNVTVTDAELNDRMAEVRKQFQTEDEFKKALAARQTSPEDLKKDMQTDLIVNKMLEAEIVPKVQVQPAELETYYKENPDRFLKPEEIRASHVLIPLKADMTEAQKKEARATADTVLKKAKAGEDFAALAKQYSKDSSAQAGGDLNFFGKGQMVPAFEAAAFTLKPGDISDVVETPFGFHIIKVTEKRGGSAVPLAEVSDRLKEFLMQQKQQDMAKAFVQTLRGKYKVEVLI